MKYIYIILICVMFKSLVVNAQFTEVLSVNAPYGIAATQNTLYFTTFENKIFKIDLGITNPPIIEVVSGLDGSDGLLIDGDYLYISEFSGNKISKINITETNPTLIDVVTGLDGPLSMAIKDDYLYIAESGADKVSKIDLNDVNATLLDVVTNVEYPVGLALNGNELYISQNKNLGGSQPPGDKILKIDITETNPTITTVLSGFDCWHILLIGNEIYYGDGREDKISKIDITESNPVPVDIVTSYDNPLYLAFDGNNLYFSSFTTDNISKIDLNSLSTNEIYLNNNYKIYPNPAKDFLYVSGFNDIVKYDIFNITGQKVLTDEIYQKEEINLTNLKSGIYFINIDNNRPVKIIKK